MGDLTLDTWTSHGSLGNPDQGASLWWLGQAGFLIEIAGQRIVIDAYLSDTLAEKYRGTRFPHIRMMPPPADPAALFGVDLILCTHGHTDHMDPGTLPPLLAANPDARVVVPASQWALATERGVPKDRLALLDAGERLDIGALSIVATPAAHETVALDGEGRHLFLGYAIRGGGVTLWHSGDTIRFPGLVEAVAPLDVDLALLPVNGRDTVRTSNGVPGNLTLDEAVDLTRAIGAGAMIGHHLDLFEFNTLDRAEGKKRLAQLSPEFPVHLAETKTRYRQEPQARSAVTRVLAVCRGNICRSPLAEAVLRDVLPEPQFEIDSAALKDWHVGKAPDPRSVAVAARHGLDTTGQRVRQVGPTDFEAFDFILAMDLDNLAALEALRPARGRARILLLRNCLERGAPAEIADPYDGGEREFEICFQEILQSCEALEKSFINRG